MQCNRKTMGLTQAQLAELMGVAPNTIARWERGSLKMPKVAALAFEGLWMEALAGAAKGGDERRALADFFGSDRLAQLIRLCHPDKHRNSPMSTEVTQWLLWLRDSQE